MAEQNRVELVVSREEAKLRVQKRLEIGEELLSRAISSKEALEQAKDERKIWTDVTAEELRQIAAADELAEKFYKKSIGLDSSFADPYFNLAFIYYMKATKTGEGYNWLDSMSLLIERGLELGPGSAVAYQLKYLYS